MQLVEGSIAEQLKRHALELNGNFGVSLRQALARAEIEGNARPAPIVDIELEGNKSFGARLGVDSRLGPVARHSFVGDYAVPVLSAYALLQHIFGVQRLQRMQDLGLFISYGIGLKRDGRLHRSQAEQLHDVVGHHVAQGSGVVEIGAAPLYSDRLGIRDLHVIDVAPVPDGLEDGIVEAEDHDVLYGLFAQIVIDAVDLVFLQHAFDVAVQGLGGFQILSEGLLDDDTAPASILLPGEFGFA